VEKLGNPFFFQRSQSFDEKMCILNNFVEERGGRGVGGGRPNRRCAALCEMS
jgi:hypothetical protein